MASRIVADQCVGVIIDLQRYFLSQASEPIRPAVKFNAASLARLLGYFRIPTVVTLERPVERKGSVLKELKPHLGDLTKVFEKDFFDLTKEKAIRDHLRRLKRKQAIVAGCETDVCVLQSCLGLLDLDFEVYVVEELIFSSAANVDSAIARMQRGGVVFLSYKSLFYELIEAVDGGLHMRDMLGRLGPFPDDLPDQAA